MKNLPHFTIRESPKAKRVILKVSDRHGLEVVIPPGFSHHRVTQIIREKREWIEQAIRKINHSKSIPKQPRKLPDTIFLKAVNLAFEVEYVPVAIPLLELKHLSPASIRISGDLKDLSGLPGPSETLAATSGPGASHPLAGAAQFRDRLALSKSPDSWPKKPLGQLFQRQNHLSEL